MTCDFAEYYGITDLRGLPVKTLATLACGLPQNARVVRIEAGTTLTVEQTLLAAICDRLSILCWQNTKDGHNGTNRPKSILAELNQKETEKAEVFSSASAFLAERERLLNGGG